MSTDDWQLNPKIFELFMKHFKASVTIELFASDANCLTKRYLTKEIDAFKIPWNNETPYLNPPFSKINDCLFKIVQDEVGCAFIVVPYWPNASWFQQFCRLATEPGLLVDNDSKDIFLHQGQHIIKAPPLKYPS